MGSRSGHTGPSYLPCTGSQLGCLVPRLPLLIRDSPPQRTPNHGRPLAPKAPLLTPVSPIVVSPLVVERNRLSVSQLQTFLVEKVLLEKSVNRYISTTYAPPRV